MSVSHNGVGPIFRPRKGCLESRKLLAEHRQQLYGPTVSSQESRLSYAKPGRFKVLFSLASITTMLCWSLWFPEIGIFMFLLKKGIVIVNLCNLLQQFSKTHQFIIPMLGDVYQIYLVASPDKCMVPVYDYKYECIRGYP